MIRKILFLAFLTVLSSGTFSQESPEDLSLLSNGKLKRLGTQAMYNQNNYSAIRYFEELVRHREDDEVMYLLAENYRIVRNYPFALYWYDRAYKANPERNAKALYYFATILQINQDYEEAAKQFNEFGRIYRDYPDSREFRRLARTHQQACEEARDSMENPVKVRISHIGSSINTEADELAPMFLTPTTMIYATMPFDTLAIDADSIRVPEYFAANKTPQGWEGLGPYELQASDNPLEYAQNGAFSPDFQRFYFVKCENIRRFILRDIQQCALYQSKKIFGVWQEAERLPENINIKNANIFSVTVGNDSRRNEEILYYVTDREDGRGGLDIWYTMYDSRSESWRDPRNGGARINSPGDEVTPYYDVATRTLYFSSNGHGGFGGFDIFFSIGELGRWTPAENMGYPINSSHDDYYFTISEDGKEGVFASNRPGSLHATHPGCCDDLYVINFEEIIEIPVTGRVFELEDEELSKILDEGFVRLTEEKKDTLDIHFIQGSKVSLYVGNRNEKVFISATETDENGAYFFNVAPNRDYVLQFEHVRHGSALISFSTRNIVVADTIYIDDYGINHITREPLIIKNIYYEYGKYRLTPEHRRTIDGAILKLLKEAPEIVVEISSHTDNHGSAEFNYGLSERRANEIINYLVRNGIERERLQGKGYGFDRPIAPNQHPDGTDNPEGRQLNRRTEFRVVGSVDNYIIDYDSVDQ